MQTFLKDSPSVTYHHGSKINLTYDWRDKNVICPNSKIYYILDGEICIEVGNTSFTARRGDAVLIPAGVKHSYHLSELGYAEKYWFHFDLRCGQNNYFDLIDLPYLKNIGVKGHIKSLFEKVINSKNEMPSEKISVLSAIMSIISIYLEGEEFTSSSPEENDDIRKVTEYIAKNYAEELTLEELSAMAKLSPNYFARRFKEKIGYPPIKYVNILRIERAKFLLEHSDKPISAIMEEVGFWDAAHFSKLFKLETGYSPSKFRRALATRKLSLNKI